MECVSFVWLAIECSIDERSPVRVSVVRGRRRDLGTGPASAFRPGASQLLCMNRVLKRETYYAVWLHVGESWLIQSMSIV